MSWIQWYQQLCYLLFHKVFYFHFKRKVLIQRLFYLKFIFCQAFHQTSVSITQWNQNENILTCRSVDMLEINTGRLSLLIFVLSVSTKGWNLPPKCDITDSSFSRVFTGAVLVLYRFHLHTGRLALCGWAGTSCGFLLRGKYPVRLYISLTVNGVDVVYCVCVCVFNRIKSRFRAFWF